MLPDIAGGSVTPAVMNNQATCEYIQVSAIGSDDINQHDSLGLPHLHLITGT